jgi:hypothetical protein
MSENNVPLTMSEDFWFSFLQALEQDRQELGVSDANFRKLGTPECRVLVRRFAELLAKKAPTTIAKNANGHYVTTISGQCLTGREEITWLDFEGFPINEWARRVLVADEYDKYHRLVNGKKYPIVFIPWEEPRIPHTNANLKAYGTEKFGYLTPKAGIIPHILKTVSCEQMEKMGIYYIAALHNAIETSRQPSVLYFRRMKVKGDNLELCATWGVPDFHDWGESGAFVYLDPNGA